jgi:hypothetical protein
MKRHTRILLIGLLFTSLTVFAKSSTAAPQIYTFATNAPQSSDYSVTVDGKPLFLLDTKVAAIATFGITGQTEIRVKPISPFHDVVIRPLSKGIKPTVENGEISFTIDSPMQLSLELDGKFGKADHPLLFFANAPEHRPVDLKDPNLIYFASGQIHQAGAITPKSNQTVYLAGGAIIEGYLDIQNSTNVKVMGPGVLDGPSVEKPLPPERGHNMIHIQRSMNVEIRDILVINGDWNWTFHMIQSTDILVENLKMVVWFPRGVDGIDVNACQRVKILNSFIMPGDDCIAIKCMTYDPKNYKITSDVLVKGCVFWNQWQGNGLEIGYELKGDAVRNISFQDCDLIHMLAGQTISIHNGDSATVENVSYENLRIEDASHSPSFVTLRLGLSGYSQDFPDQYKKQKDGTIVPMPKEIGVKESLGGNWIRVADPKQLDAGRGCIRNISFKNIQLLEDKFPPILLIGYDDLHMIDGITFQGISIGGKSVTNWPEKKMKVEFTKNLQFLP